jgi:integrase/recombinase XerD
MQLREAITFFLRVRILEARPGTAQNTAYQLRMLCLYLGNREVASITLEDILEYIRHLKNRGLKPNTLVAPCAYLRKFFRYLAAHGYTRVNANLIPLPKPEMKPAQVATEEAYRTLLAAIPDTGRLLDVRNRCLLNFLWDTGARIGEITALDTSRMDLERMRAVISTGKVPGQASFPGDLLDEGDK